MKRRSILKSTAAAITGLVLPVDLTAENEINLQPDQPENAVQSRLITREVFVTLKGAGSGDGSSIENALSWERLMKEGMQPGLLYMCRVPLVDISEGLIGRPQEAERTSDVL